MSELAILIIGLFMIGTLFILGLRDRRVRVRQEDPIVAEMRRKAARDYYNNPVVNELKKD